MSSSIRKMITRLGVVALLGFGVSASAQVQSFITSPGQNSWNGKNITVVCSSARAGITNVAFYRTQTDLSAFASSTWAGRGDVELIGNDTTSSYSASFDSRTGSALGNFPGAQLLGFL